MENIIINPEKYNRIFFSAYSKCGVIYPMGKDINNTIEDGYPIVGFENIQFELRDGIYCDFMHCVGIGKFVSEAMKELLSKYISEEDEVVFIPVTVHSKDSGDREYFFMHYNKIKDSIDYENSTMNPETNEVIKIAIDYNKVKGKEIFVIPSPLNNLVVTNKVMREIIKSKLKFGISFFPIYCYNKPSSGK